MKSGIILAIVASLVLVGGASWSRLSSSKSASNLIAVEQNRATDDAYLQEAFASYQNSASTTVTTEPLTGTDLIGRQLMTDYLNLATSGQINEDSIANLADKYVESIPTLISSEQVLFTDLQLVSNDKTNFEKYAKEISEVYKQYSAGMLKLESNRGFTSFTINQDFSDASTQMASLYQKTASGLRNLFVPVAIAQNHLDLVNLYLKNSAGMFSMSKAENDPASAFAGLIIISGNINKEVELWGSVQEVLTKNGV